MKGGKTPESKEFVESEEEEETDYEHSDSNSAGSSGRENNQEKNMNGSVSRNKIEKIRLQATTKFS